jgi:hypothetical protein
MPPDQRLPVLPSPPREERDRERRPIVKPSHLHDTNLSQLSLLSTNGEGRLGQPRRIAPVQNPAAPPFCVAFLKPEKIVTQLFFKKRKSECPDCFSRLVLLVKNDNPKPMKNTALKIKLAVTCAALLLAGAPRAVAEETAKAKQTSAEFERMKSLVGTWKGTADIGQGPAELVVQYRLLAGGTTLEERVFAGTPNEMLTLYYEQGGKLALTHYCIMGNRPGMLLKSSDAKSLTFDFDPACGINTATESHMHAMSIRFEDENTIVTSCRAMMGGKDIAEHPTTLKRVKSQT